MKKVRLIDDCCFGRISTKNSKEDVDGNEKSGSVLAGILAVIEILLLHILLKFYSQA